MAALYGDASQVECRVQHLNHGFNMKHLPRQFQGLGFVL
jgi:hypothetical protein